MMLFLAALPGSLAAAPAGADPPAPLVSTEPAAAIEALRRRVAAAPNDPAAAGLQNEIVKIFNQMGNREDTFPEVARLVDTYGEGSAWARANAADPVALEAAAALGEKALRAAAVGFHNDAKKLRTGAEARRAWALAEQAYEAYLKTFPASKYGYEVRYAYSELLYALKKYDAAYEQYMRVVAIDPGGAHAKFCAESAIFAADEMIRTEAPIREIGGHDPQPLSEWEQRSLAALDQYARMFPDQPKTPNVLYKAAYLLYNRNRFKEASERFHVVIGMNPATEEAEQAANLVLDSFMQAKDWRSLRDSAKAFYDQPGLGSETFKSELHAIYVGASEKLGE